MYRSLSIKPIVLTMTSLECFALLSYAHLSSCICSPERRSSNDFDILDVRTYTVPSSCSCRHHHHHHIITITAMMNIQVLSYTATKTKVMQGTTALSLSSLVQEHLTTLVREASCIQRHFKRARYHETASGDGSDGILRKRLHADDINLALQWRGSEKLYATGVVVPPGPGEDPTTKPIDLNAYLRSENQVPLPSELGLSSHWLAVDGVQPNIAQNPAVASSSTSTFPLGPSCSRRARSND